MSSVPEDVYPELLLWVPAKSLVICKCVCKSWFQIISNPSFAKMHLDFSKQRKNYNLLFESYDDTNRRWTINSVSYNLLLSAVNGSESEYYELAGYPFQESTNFGFLGSCDGLVCIWFIINSEKFICFFNPATREYKKIISKSYLIKNSAFGFDCKADDYKLIIIYELGSNSWESRIELLVYTLGSDSWECSDHIMPYKFSDKRQTGVLVHGAFHWLGEVLDRNSSKLIITLDITNQIFGKLQLPEEVLLEDMGRSMTIAVLEGCLGVLLMLSNCFEVWVKQDYGVHESWTRHFIIDHERIRDVPRLMWSFGNDQILLMNGNKLVIYDPKHSSIREPETISSLWLYHAVNYVESLVSLNSGTYACSISAF